MSVSRQRVAIVGAGIGAQHLTGWLANGEAAEVAVICDLDESRAAPLAATAREAGHDTRTDASLDRVLADPSIDIVDVCLPPRLHLDAIRQALAHGHHVVCEKPLVASLAEADEVARAASAANRNVMPVFQYRFGAGLGKLLALIDADLAGRPLVATLETHWRRDADYYGVPWRGRWASELGGAIVGHAIHAHDLLTRVLGPIAAVQATLATRVNDIEVDDCAAIALTLANGALATSSVTLGAADDRSRLRFCFERLSAESGLDPYNPAAGEWTFQPRVPAAQGDEVQRRIDAVIAAYPPHRDGYARQFDRFLAALGNGSPPPVTLADARASLELVTAIYASDASGERIALPLGTDAPGYGDWSTVARSAQVVPGRR